MPQARIKYISGLLLFGLNGVVSSRLAMPSISCFTGRCWGACFCCCSCC